MLDGPAVVVLETVDREHQASTLMNKWLQGRRDSNSRDIVTGSGRSGTSVNGKGCTWAGLKTLFAIVAVDSLN